MTEEQVLAVLGKFNAVIANSHVVYSSWKHGRAYVNKDAIYPHIAEISQLCFYMARPFASRNEKIEVVVGPALGGIILSQRVAEHLETIQGSKVLSLYAEKDGENFVIKRGYDKFLPEKRTLVVEDVLTTGGTSKKVIEVVRNLGGNVVGLSAICNRGGVTPTSVGSVRMLHALLNIQMDAYDPSECPMCQDGTPINVEVGKGREFLKQKQAN